MTYADCAIVNLTEDSPSRIDTGNHSLIFVTWTTPETLLKFSLYDFNDYDDELAHLQIPTHD